MKKLILIILVGLACVGWTLDGMDTPSTIDGMTGFATVDGMTITPADQTLYPTSDNNTAWTCSAGIDRYAMVDETSQDGDTTYIYRQDSGTYQMFDNLPTLPTGSILGVSIYFYAKQQTGTTTGRPRLVVNGTEYLGTAENLTSSYVEYSTEWTTNPDTAGAWTETDVEGTGSNPLQQWGLTGSIQAGEETRATQIRLVVRYN